MTDYDFEEELISERIPDIQQILTQRSLESRPKPSYHSTRPDLSSFDVRKLLLETEQSSTREKKDYESVLVRSVKFEQLKE